MCVSVERWRMFGPPPHGKLTGGKSAKCNWIIDFPNRRSAKTNANRPGVQNDAIAFKKAISGGRYGGAFVCKQVLMVMRCYLIDLLDNT